MTYERGAALCLKLGLHGPWRRQELVDVCAECGLERLAQPPLFDDDEVDRFDARDANRAELEACGNPSGNEADAHRSWPE